MKALAIICEGLYNTNMNYQTCLHLFFFLIATGNLLSQSGFKTELNVTSTQPNGAYHTLEFNEHYYMSGQYFDDSIPAWNGFIAIYDSKGNYIKHHTISNDTLAVMNISHNVHVHDDTYNILSVFGGFANIVTYDFELDSLYTTKKFDLVSLDIVPLSMYPDFDNEIFYLAGVNNDSMKVVKITPADTIQFVDGEPLRDKVVFNLQMNSKDQLVMVAEDKRLGWNSDKDTTHIKILDTNLNVLHDNSIASSNPNIEVSASKGMLIDDDDNIVITGNHLELIDTPSSLIHYLNTPSIAKFDDEGHHLWTTRLGNNVYNILGKGLWKSVVESAEKDGYVVVGGESYQPDYYSDTLITSAAIAKLSNNGDSLWMRRFNWRTGVEIEDRFNDVVATSDGGYLVCGQSVNRNPQGDADLPWIKSILIKLDRDGLLDTSTVSAIQLNKEGGLDVYPNPTNDYLYLTQNSEDQLQVKIIASDGRLVDQFMSFDLSHTQVLDVSSYDSGLYFIYAICNNKRYVHKFIVQ